MHQSKKKKEKKNTTN